MPRQCACARRRCRPTASFTDGQAKDRAVATGATEIAELKKDDNGVWRGVAKHDGKSGEVAIDYKGNVVFQTSP